jgi:hypothetical protein
VVLVFVVHKNRNINPQMDFLNYQYFVHMFKKAVRQAENAGDMPPPARGCPTFGRAGVTGISACLTAFLNICIKS